MARPNRISLLLIGLVLVSIRAGGIQIMPAALGSNGNADVTINEIALGPVEYIELYNGTPSAQSLVDITLATAQGTFSLSDVTTPLPAGGVFVLSRDTSSGVEPGGSTKRVTTSLLHYGVDTVILKRGSTIVDAMSYGVQQDASSRYTDAVNAGEFANGTRVDTGTVIGGFLSLGRNKNGSDTNNLVNDWKLRGGADAFGPSRGVANLGGALEKNYMIWRWQKWINDVLANGFGLQVTTASHSNWTAIGNTASATNIIVIKGLPGDPAPFDQQQALSGTLTTSFTKTGNGYSYTDSGTLANASVSLTIQLTEVVTGTASP